ncbi:MAG TPA: magnesium/cobalt transporter CorA [Actinomycetota bacterium]|nr:magnesium/cobalt transporter CorA [Actinomycetota bacterium]
MRTCMVFREGRGEPVDTDEAERFLRERSGTVWIDIEDPTDDDRAFLGESFGLHGLSLEDIEHRDQRPRVEAYEGYRFVSLRPLSLEVGDGEIAVAEIHAIVAPDVFVTLRYEPAYDVGTLRTRLLARPDLVEHGTGGMVYVLFDAVVDDQLDIVDRLEQEVEDLEELVFDHRPVAGDPELDVLRRRFHALRVNLAVFRRHVAPLRRAVEALHEDRELVGPELAPYYRDLADHVLRALDFQDNVRDVLTSLIEVRMTQQANDLNEVMKKLSAWAGIILVPTLIAGIYGMNFDDMPELHWALGYPLALAMMGASALALWFTFRRQGWL